MSSSSTPTTPFPFDSSSHGSTGGSKAGDSENDTHHHHHHHRRHVHQYQPSESNQYLSSSPTATSSPSLLSSTTSQQQHRLTVQDIVQMTPHESEVETMIFDSIEQQQQVSDLKNKKAMQYRGLSSLVMNHPSSNHSLWNCIPDESLRYYIGNGSSTGGSSSTTSTTTTAKPPSHAFDNDPSPTVKSTFSTTTTTTTIPTFDLHPYHPPDRTTPTTTTIQNTPLRSNRTSSNATTITNNHKKSNDFGRSPYRQHHHPLPPLSRSSHATALHPLPPRHRRSTSIQSTTSSITTTNTTSLASMAQQLDAFQNGTDDDHPHHHSLSPLPVHRDPSYRTASPTSSSLSSKTTTYYNNQNFSRYNTHHDTVVSHIPNAVELMTMVPPVISTTTNTGLTTMTATTDDTNIPSDAAAIIGSSQPKENVVHSSTGKRPLGSSTLRPFSPLPNQDYNTPTDIGCWSFGGNDDNDDVKDDTDHDALLLHPKSPSHYDTDTIPLDVSENHCHPNDISSYTIGNHHLATSNTSSSHTTLGLSTTPAVLDWSHHRKPTTNITVTTVELDSDDTDEEDDDDRSSSSSSNNNDSRHTGNVSANTKWESVDHDTEDIEWGEWDSIGTRHYAMISSLPSPPSHSTSAIATTPGQFGAFLSQHITSSIQNDYCCCYCRQYLNIIPTQSTLVSTIHELWNDFDIFLQQRQKLFLSYIRYFLLIVIPAMMIAFILFYIAGNPPTGKVHWTLSGNGILVQESGVIIPPNQASVAWWLLFLVRQALTFSLAQIVQIIIVDFWCLNTRFFVNTFGRLISLFLTSWKGWPFIAFLWGVIDFIVLYGESKFAAHWLHWQRIFYIFTNVNPSGNIIHSKWYTRILSVSVSVGLIVGIKRLWLGFYLGKKTYANHYEDLFKVYKKILSLCAVGELSRQSLTSSKRSLLSAPYSPHGINKTELEDILQHDSVAENIILPGNSCRNNEADVWSINQTQQSKRIDLIETWDEPMVGDNDYDDETGDDASIRNVLEFRNALTKLDKPYMLGIAWGDVSTRQKMVLNSQAVYWKLKRLSNEHHDGLKFDVIAELCEQPDGTLHPEELKNLIGLLRPDRDGYLSMAEFVKSVDSVYKEAKLIHASVKNSEKIDREFEKALNMPFYTIVTCIILSQIGLNPLALFISLSPLILGFSWMIGSASSNMFEGWLFILIRRPYNIGDRIHISNVESETSWDGSASWIVQDVTLFHTVAVFGMTGERASMSNGSLASSRVLNMARSPNAIVYVHVKFSTKVAYETIQTFQQILQKFIQSRPRKWTNMASFRVARVVADLGFIEYVVHLIHRESWQSALSIYESKAEVTSFCLELSKKLEMRYENPTIHVDLTTSTTIGKLKSQVENNSTSLDNGIDRNSFSMVDGKLSTSNDTKNNFSLPGSINSAAPNVQNLKEVSNIFHEMMKTMDSTNSTRATTALQHNL